MFHCRFIPEAHSKANGWKPGKPTHLKYFYIGNCSPPFIPNATLKVGQFLLSQTLYGRCFEKPSSEPWFLPDR